MYSYNIIIFLVTCLTLCKGVVSGVINISSDEDGNWKDIDISRELQDSEYIVDSGAANIYWLYTRNNPDVPQLIIDGKTDTILESNYDASKPLKVIVHGWTGSIDSRLNMVVKSSYLKTDDVNIIVVDWNENAGGDYVDACLRVPSTGRYLGNFIDWVVNTAGGSWNTVHLIGYSLGAHVVGNAGRAVDGKPKRITGLDPAGPLWGSTSYALAPNDGQYVEAIHTNLIGRGIAKALGQVDFYPNGGRMQPGCDDIHCSHARAYELFAASVENSNHFVGRQCSSAVTAIAGHCSGGTFVMGNADLSKTGSGIYHLTTTDTWPF